MDNQQGKTRETLLAWIAGFWDGEGTFRLFWDKRGSRLPQPRISLYNTHYPSLEIITAALDVVGFPHYVVHRPSQFKNWQPQWGIHVYGVKRCLQWCETLAPYTIVKKDKVAAIIEYCQIRLTQPYHGGAITERQLELYQIVSGNPPQTTRETDLIESDGIVEPSRKREGARKYPRWEGMHTDPQKRYLKRMDPES